VASPETGWRISRTRLALDEDEPVRRAHPEAARVSASAPAAWHELPEGLDQHRGDLVLRRPPSFTRLSSPFSRRAAVA